MGNSNSHTGVKRKPNILLASLDDNFKVIPNFENRWQTFIKSLDVPEEKIKIIESLEDSKKYKLILEYIFKKKEETQNLINTISSLEISLRTNSVDWILQFINESGLESLINVMSNVLFLLSNTIDLQNKSNVYHRKNYESPFTPSKERKNSAVSLKSSTNDLPNSAKFLQVNNDAEKTNYDTNPRVNQTRLITVLSPGTIEKLKEILHLSLKCLKSLLNNQTGCKRAFNYPSVCDIITFCLLHPSFMTKQLSLEMLSAVCLIEGGHSKVLLSFDCLQREIGEVSRFEWLMNDFRKHEEKTNPEEYNIDYAVSCMQFINIVVHSCENINLRVYLQYCFHLLGLDKFINNIRDGCGERLVEQIDAYQHNKVDCNLLLDDAEAKEDYQRQLDSIRAKINECEKNKDYVKVIGSLQGKIKDLEDDLMRKDEDIELLQITMANMKPLNQNDSLNDNEGRHIDSLNKFVHKLSSSENGNQKIPPPMEQRHLPEGCDESNSTSGISTPESSSQSIHQHKVVVPKPKRQINGFTLDLKDFESHDHQKYIVEAEKLITKLNNISVCKTKYCLVPVKPLGWNINSFRCSYQESAFSTIVFERNLRALSMEKLSMKLNTVNIKEPWKQSIINQEKSHSRLLIEPLDEIYNHLTNLSLDPINNEYLSHMVDYRQTLRGGGGGAKSVVTRELVKIVDHLEKAISSSSTKEDPNGLHIKTHVSAIKGLTTFNLECRKIVEQLSIILSACRSIMTSKRFPIILRFVNIFVLKLTGSTEQFIDPNQHFPIHLIDTLINWRLCDVEYSSVLDSSMYKSVSFIQMFWHYLKSTHPSLVDWTNELTNIEKASACNLSGIQEACSRLEVYHQCLRCLRKDSPECLEIEENLVCLKSSIDYLTKIGYCTMNWLNEEFVSLENLPIRLSPLAKFVSAYRQQSFGSTTSNRRNLVSQNKVIKEHNTSNGDNNNNTNDLSENINNKSNGFVCKNQQNGKSSIVPVKRRSQTRQINVDGLLENILEGIHSKPLRASLHTQD